MIRATAAVVCASALGGCALPVYDDWDAAPILPPLPSRHVEVTHGELTRKCGEYAGMVLYGCAVRDFQARLCTIYTPPNAAGWILVHEQKHCAGYDHAMPGAPTGRVVSAAAYPANAH